MSVLDGKRNPDGILASAQAAPGASANSVNVGREYAMLEVSVLGVGATGTAALQRRGELFANGRTADCGGFVTVTDANNPAAGMTLAATGGTFRVAYPHGEYQVLFGTLSAGTVTASYTLTGEGR